MRSSSMIKHNGKSAEHSAMEKLLSDLQGHPLAWAFLQPVNVEEVQDYLDVVKQPMGMSTRFPAPHTAHLTACL